MKDLLLVLAIMIVGQLAIGQGIEYRNTSTIKSFGEPFIKTNSIDGQTRILIGGQGGLILNWGNTESHHQMAVGGFGNGMAGELVISSVDESDRTLSMGFGGVFVEYLHRPMSKLHFSLPLYLGIGSLSIKDGDTGDRIEKSNIITIDPGINLAYNVSSFLTIGVNLGHRWVKAKDLTYITNTDVSNINYGIQFRFGIH